MNHLEKIESDIARFNAEMREASDGIKKLLEDEERFIRRCRDERMAIDRKKVMIGQKLQESQAKLDALEAGLPREIVTAVYEREAKARQTRMDLEAHKRDLATAKWNLETMRKKGAKKEEVHELAAQVTQFEQLVDELESDLDEAEKSYEAAKILKREALEAAASEAAPRPAAAASKK